MTCPHTILSRTPGGCPICTPPAPGPAVRLGAIPPEAWRALAALQSFDGFVRQAWPLVCPEPYKSNVATDAIVRHLQAVADGDISRLLVAVAPGTAKSTLVSILYTSWRLARDPAWSVICGSHSYDLAVGLSRKARRLIESEWYRGAFGVELRRDENRENDYATTAGGRRLAVGVGGALTGFRSREAIVDDALNAVDRLSKARKDQCYSWFSEALSTRLDGDAAPLIVIMQRLAPDDLVGRLLEDQPGTWEALVLPAEFDPRRRTVTSVWTDPRHEEGQLLAPGPLPAEKLAEKRRDLGGANYEAQFNQNPISDDAAMFPRKWWRFYRAPHAAEGQRRPVGCDDAPAVALPDAFEQLVISADLTFGSAKGDYAVIQAWGSKGGGRYLLAQWRRKAGFEEQVAAIKRLAAEYPRAKIVIEKAANGAAVIETLQKAIPNVLPEVPTGSKEQRASAIVPTVESGSVYLPEHWPGLVDFVEEFAAFPGKHDDQVDAAAYALLALQGPVDPDYEEKRKRIIRTLLTCKPTHLEGTKSAVIEWLDEQLAARYPQYAPARESDYRPGESLADKPAAQAAQGRAFWELDADGKPVMTRYGRSQRPWWR